MIMITTINITNIAIYFQKHDFIIPAKDSIMQNLKLPEVLTFQMHSFMNRKFCQT